MWGLMIALVCGAVAYAGYVVFDRLKLNSVPALKRQSGSRETAKEQRPNGNDSYHQYTLSRVEWLSAVAIAAAVLGMGAYLFYKSGLICLLAALIALYFPKIRRKQQIRKRLEELRRQFKHALYSLSTALSAGRSVENAFRETANDLRLLYPDPRTDMIRELDRINRRTENGEPIEKSLLDFGRRCGIPDIVQFADAFAVCKRTGGDLVEVMRKTSDIIGEKLEIEQDISVMIAQKRFEAKALGIIPFMIVGFLSFSSPDYMEPLYGGVGRLIMTAALAMLAFSLWLARKLMNIGV